MMDFVGTCLRQPNRYSTPCSCTARTVFIQSTEFVLNNDEFRVENDQLCIQNEQFCIKNDQFCITMEPHLGPPLNLRNSSFLIQNLRNSSFLIQNASF